LFVAWWFTFDVFALVPFKASSMQQTELANVTHSIVVKTLGMEFDDYCQCCVGYYLGKGF
jgi:hypothetical protein